MIPAPQLPSSVAAVNERTLCQFHPLHSFKTRKKVQRSPSENSRASFSQRTPFPRCAASTWIQSVDFSLPSKLGRHRKGGSNAANHAISVSSRLTFLYPAIENSGFCVLQKLCAIGDAGRNEFACQPRGRVRAGNSRAQTASERDSTAEGDENSTSTFFSNEDLAQGEKHSEDSAEQGKEEDGSDSDSDKEEEKEDTEDTALVEEYSLTDEGYLTTVTVSVGGTTHRTPSQIHKVLAELGIQANSLQKKISTFSVKELIANFGKKQKGVEDLVYNSSMYDARDGLSTLTQWTATELSIQRSQMVRIAKDTQYLVWAFSLFGCVRILEAIVAVFSTKPANPKKLFDAMNALDPLTVASLAHALRKPIVGMLDVDPTHLHEVTSLKAKFWAELHKFYERQWKVMATLGIARLLTLIATNLPSYEWMTSKAKLLWDISMALPIF